MWSDPDAALRNYLDQKDELHTGRTPRSRQGSLTIRDVCNRFLTAKRDRLDTGEIVQRTFNCYHDSCRNLIDGFGRQRLVDDLMPDDFEELPRKLAKDRGPVNLGNEIGRIRSVFKYAYDQALIDRPMRFGQSFRKPSAKTLRIERAKKGPRMFSADELNTIIDAAGEPMRALVLLGANCGFGQSDLSNMPRAVAKRAIATGWIEFPRPKTGVERRCPPWPETLRSLRIAVNTRPKPEDSSDNRLAFLTTFGMPWVRDRLRRALLQVHAAIEDARAEEARSVVLRDSPWVRDDRRPEP